MIPYKDTVTFVKVSSGGYSGEKTPTQQVDVPVVFIQDTGYIRQNFQDNVDADAICYPKPDEAFITENSHRLEGMYIVAPLYGADNDDSWYKVTSVTVNRDHLLSNNVDNLELLLKKTQSIPGVS